jgi:tRNA threonylcarbamoyl adenosine modification protein YeaZ
MFLLCVERSTSRPGWALFRDSDCILEALADEEPARTPDWLARLARACAGVDVPLDRIDRFAVGLGPGSFSGTRAAVSGLQGLSLPGNRPLLGVSSAAAQAYALLMERAAAGIHSPVAVVGDARRDRLWCAVFVLGPASGTGKGADSPDLTNRPAGQLLAWTREGPRAPTHDARDFSLTPWQDLPAHLPPGTQVSTPDWDRIGARLAESLPPGQLPKQSRRPTAADVGRLILADPLSAHAEPIPIYLHPAVAAPRELAPAGPAQDSADAPGGEPPTSEAHRPARRGPSGIAGALLASFLFATGASGDSAFRRNLDRVNSLDPAQSASVPASRCVGLVYESLLEYDYTARPYRLIPGLAESLPEVSTNRRVYTFRMNPANRFPADPCFGLDAAGSPRDRAVVAADLVYALKRLADRKVASPGAWLVTDKILGMQAFAAQSEGNAPTDYSLEVEGLRAPDPLTLRIELTRPFPPFLWLLAMPYASAVPQEAVAHYGAAFGEHPVGSGPYRLTSWWRNHEMTFTRRPDWRGWRQGPAAVCAAGETPFDRIVYRVMDDAATQWLSFLAGELDFQGEIPRDNWDAVVDAGGDLKSSLAQAGIRLHGIPAMAVAYIGINMQDPVLGPNRKLRQAIQCAFDAPGWENFLNHRVTRADGPVPPNAAGYSGEPFAYGFDLARARKRLAEAGYPDGRDPATGRRLALAIDLGRTTQQAREETELLGAFLARVGIDLQPCYHNFPAFLRKVTRKGSQLFRIDWVGDYPDAENFLQLFYTPNRSPGPNHCNYSNPAFDSLYEQAAAAEDDETVRLDCFRRMQAILREDCPWIFLHFPRSFSLVHQRVRNYIPHDFPYGMEKYLRVRAGECGTNAAKWN